MKMLTLNKSVDQVRDKQHALVDDERATRVMIRLWDTAHNGTNIEITPAEASDIIAMLESPDYLRLIANRLG